MHEFRFKVDKCSLLFCLYIQKDYDLVKRSVETFSHPLCSKFEPSVHANFAITFLFILLGNVLVWHQLETYFNDIP